MAELWKHLYLRKYVNFIRFVSSVGALPVFWNENLGRFELENRQWRWFIWYIRVLITFAYATFLSVRLTHCWGFGGIKLADLIMTMSWWTIYVLIAALHLNTALRIRDIVEFLRKCTGWELMQLWDCCKCLYQVFEALTHHILHLICCSNFQGVFRREERKLVGCFHLFNFIAIMSVLTMTFMFAYQPRKPYYMPSIVLRYTESCAFVVAFSVFEFFQYLVNWAIVLFYIHLMFGYFTMMAAVLRKLR